MFDYLNKLGLSHTINRIKEKLKKLEGVELTKAQFDALPEEERNNGDYYTFGSTSDTKGTYYHNGKSYTGDGDNSKTVTYEQYKNLPEAEKKNGTTYYVPDYPGGSSGGLLESRNIVLTSVTPSAKYGATLLDYPDGFNKENTIILGAMFQGIQDNNWHDLYGPSKNDIYIFLTDANICVYMPTEDANMMNRPIKITITNSDITSIAGSEIVDNLDSTDTNKALSANMGRELHKKIIKNYANVSVAPGYGEVLTKNILKIINNTLYIDAFINITKEIPNNRSVFGVDDGEQTIVFNRRCDTSLIGVKYENNDVTAMIRMLTFVPGVNDYFFANGASIPVGAYQLKATIDLD